MLFIKYIGKYTQKISLCNRDRPSHVDRYLNCLSYSQIHDVDIETEIVVFHLYNMKVKIALKQIRSSYSSSLEEDLIYIYSFI